MLVLARYFKLLRPYASGIGNSRSRGLSAEKRGRADAGYTRLVSARGEAPWSDRMLVLARYFKLLRPYAGGIAKLTVSQPN
jgi:hypothetical protein